MFHSSVCVVLSRKNVTKAKAKEKKVVQIKFAAIKKIIKKTTKQMPNLRLILLLVVLVVAKHRRKSLIALSID